MTRGLPNAYDGIGGGERDRWRVACTIRGTPCGSPTDQHWLWSEPPRATSRPCAGERPVRPQLVSAIGVHVRTRAVSCSVAARWAGPVGQAPLTVKAASSSSKRSSFLIAKSGPCRSEGPVADVMATLLIRAVPSRRPLLSRRSAEGGRAGSRRLGATCIAAMAIERSPRKLT